MSMQIRRKNGTYRWRAVERGIGRGYPTSWGSWRLSIKAATCAPGESKQGKKVFCELHDTCVFPSHSLSYLSVSSLLPLPQSVQV